jgi:hypothetical protein
MNQLNEVNFDLCILYLYSFILQSYECLEVRDDCKTELGFQL